MRTRPLAALVVTATAAVLAPSALAAPTGTVIETVSRTGAVVTASGTATFDGVADVASVGGTNTQFAPDAPSGGGAAVSGAAGIDLTDALIETMPDGLRFTWKLAALPAQIPPEGTRYTWSFGIGDETFQLQAKRTNLASVTLPDDPAGHVGALAGSGFFQLRGNCSDNYLGLPDESPTKVSGCPHLAFLEGSFDTANAAVTMTVPFGLETAPAIAPGTVLTEVVTAGMSITAGFQAGISNTLFSDFTNGWQPYYVGPNVAIGTGTATANPASVSYTPATLAADGTWTGEVAKVLATHKKLHVRTCEGATATCTYTSVPLP